MRRPACPALPSAAPAPTHLPITASSRRQEDGCVLWGELCPQTGDEPARVQPQIVVEVAEIRGEHQRQDPASLRPAAAAGIKAAPRAAKPQPDKPAAKALPKPRPASAKATQAGTKPAGTDGTFVSMGNPHYVNFVDDIREIDVAGRGKELEFAPSFPERCNIEFAQMNPQSIRTRVWERGSGITWACGTGACATAVAAAKTGRAGRQSDIVMDGGTLHIEWGDDNHVRMTGPAEFVFDGEMEL